MKSKASLRAFLALSGSALLLATQAHANYYWDTNSTTSGLGNTAGTWGISANWGSLIAANSRSIVAGTFATANTTITNAHTVYFGTVNLALGSTASTIGITGAGVTVNRIVFGAGQGAQGVTLSGGGGSITLSGTTPSIVANNSGTNTIGAVLNGTVGLVKGGSGTVLLTGTNGITGGVTLTGGGTLQVGDGTSGSLTSQALTFNNGGGLLNVRSLNAGSTQAMGALTFSTTGIGDGTVQSTYGTSGSAALTFTSLAARGAGATGNFVVSGGTNGSTNKIVLTGAATGTLLDKGLFFGGSSFAAYDATGYVRAYGTGDANFVSIGAGPDMGAPAATDNVLLTGSLSAQSVSAVNTINMGAHSIAMDASGTDLVLQTNGLLSSGSGSATIGGGTTPRLQSATSGGEMVIRVDGGSDALNISSFIQNNTSASALTKTGAGTLTLSGANIYTGTTRINSGTLVVSGGSAIVDTGAVVLANAAGATLQLDNNETILNVTGGGFSGGNVNVQGNTLTLADAAGYTFGGTFTGAGGVIKQGAGTLILSNKNAFAGAITLEGGALEFTYGNDGTGTLIPLSSGGAINMSNGTTLRFNAATNLPAGVYGAQLQAANGGSPAYPYGWTVANNINIASGTTTANIRVGGNENSVRFTGNVTGGTSDTQTLAIFAGGIATGAGDRQPNVFSGTIANGIGGTLGVNVDFAGASGTAQNVFVSLSGQNTFTGPIVVTNSKGLTGVGTGGGYLGIGGEIHSAGPTFVPGTGYLGGGNYTSTIALAAGTKLTYLSSANQTLGGQISGAGELIKRGSGALTLSTTNNYTGATTVSEGKLIISGSTSTTSLVTVASGATLGGTGTVGGNTTLNGILSPGTSPGTLTFTGNLTVNNLSTYIFEAGDLTNVGGTLDLNDNWTLALGTGFQNGGTVMIFDYGTLAVSPDLVPTFDITNLGFTPSGALSLTDTGTSIVLNGVSVIPEPSSAVLGGLGLLALLRRRRTA